MSRRHRSTIHPLVVLLLAALLAGCGTRHIRAAQDAFNEGAAQENAQRVAALSGGQPAVDATSAAASYRVALRLLDQELADHRDALETDQLLGTALMLRALALWRLADLEAGTATAPARAALDAAIARATGEGGAQLGTRDRTLAAALPGLYDHDAGLRARSLAEADGRFRSAYQLVGEAVRSTDPPANHPVRTYLALAQLTTLRAFQSAIYRFAAAPDGIPPEHDMRTVRDIHTCAKRVVLQLKPVLRDDVELKQLVERVNTTIGISSVDAITAPGEPCRFDA